MPTAVKTCPACDSPPGVAPKPPSKLRQLATKRAAPSTSILSRLNIEAKGAAQAGTFVGQGVCVVFRASKTGAPPEQGAARERAVAEPRVHLPPLVPCE